MTLSDNRPAPTEDSASWRCPGKVEVRPRERSRWVSSPGSATRRRGQGLLTTSWETERCKITFPLMRKSKRGQEGGRLGTRDQCGMRTESSYLARFFQRDASLGKREGGSARSFHR